MKRALRSTKSIYQNKSLFKVALGFVAAGLPLSKAPDMHD